MKETPKGNNQESESEEESSAEDDERRFPLLKILQVVAVMWLGMLLLDDTEKQISFEEFKKKLLEPGLVDRIVISKKSVAKVYVRNSPGNQTTDGTIEGNSIDSPAKLKIGPLYSIESVESFMKKLEEAQEALGIDTHDYVPVTCVSEVDWDKRVRRELRLTMAEVLVLGSLVYLLRNMQADQAFMVWSSMFMFLLMIQMWFDGMYERQ